MEAARGKLQQLRWVAVAGGAERAAGTGGVDRSAGRSSRRQGFHDSRRSRRPDPRAGRLSHENPQGPVSPRGGVSPCGRSTHSNRALDGSRRSLGGIDRWSRSFSCTARSVPADRPQLSRADNDNTSCGAETLLVAPPANVTDSLNAAAFAVELLVANTPEGANF